jgi:hypothetical protein
VQWKAKNGIATYWNNNSTRAGVLGCVDWYQICTDSSGSRCWDMVGAEDALEEFQNDRVKQRALYLVLIGLKNSITFHTINYRRANILNATAEIAQMIGIRLAPEQWKVEVENIFKGTLAYIQLRVYDFARGTYAHYPDMVDATDPRVRAVDVGRMYKFRDVKFMNVSALGFWGGLSLCIVLIAGSFRFSDADRAKKAEKRGNRGYHNALWIYILLHSFITLLIWPFKKVWQKVVSRGAPRGSGASRSGDEEEARTLDQRDGEREGVNASPRVANGNPRDGSNARIDEEQGTEEEANGSSRVANGVPQDETIAGVSGEQTGEETDSIISGVAAWQSTERN